MKKMTMVALAATAFMAFSCSDDDNDTTTSSLGGTWKLMSATSNQAVDGNGDGTSSTDLMAETGTCYGDSFVEFSNGDTFSSSMTMPATEGGNCATTTDQGTYKVVQNSVRTTFVHDGETQHVNYIKTGNLLTLTVTDIQVMESGETTPVTLTAKMVFKKQ